MTGIKHLLRKCLSARMQYRLWFLLLSFMAVPFLPANIFSILQKFPALHLSDFPKRLFLSVPDGQVFIKEHSAIERDALQKENPDIQYRIFEITCYCGAHTPSHLPSDSFDFRF